MTTNHGKRAALAAALVCLLGWASGTLAQAASEERRSFTASRLELNNLIGEVSVSGHDGAGFEVVVRPGGKDAREGTLEIVAAENAGRAEMTIRFPEAQRFVYPALGAGSTARFDPDDNDERSWLAELVHGLFGKRITVTGSGSGLEVWADVEIRVPRNGALVLHHGVGNVIAGGVTAELELETRSGGIDASKVEGTLNAETGSGTVTIADVSGKVSIATGSGGVDARDVHGPAARVATGSGRVKLERVDSDSLEVATGSGGIEAVEVGAGEAAFATGSGSVSLALGRMGAGPFKVATGSGGVALFVPRGASMDVHAETGSGGIDLDLAGEMNVTQRERDEVAFTIGGGQARVRIGTGSGSIRIANRG